MDNYLHKLYNWYKQNKRYLPWRETIDPYKIWVSEIILQQTRISQGINYYLRFIHNFPSVVDLAHANEDEVLKLWQGLGYYSRARNLHKGAKQVLINFDGTFPTEYSDIISIKGVGEYTAAAIASIAYNLPYPTVDGNVYRFLARFFNLSDPIDSTKGKKLFYQLANNILLKENPGMHNQALMEFGALQCIPKNPDCVNCPLSEECIAFSENTVSTVPVKGKKTKQRDRHFNYVVIENKKGVYIQKRTNKDIWENLYEFPLIETTQELTIEEIITGKEFKKIFGNSGIVIKETTETKTHILSHQKIHYRFIHIYSEDIALKNPKFILIKKENINTYPVSRLIEIYVEKHFN